MKKILALVIAMLSFVLVACQSSKTSESTTDKKDSLTMVWSEDFGDVNPHRYNPDQFVIQDMVYEGLVRYGDNGVIEPVLAESWEVSEDGKIYTFKLRDAKYSDGSKVTAENIKRNFDTIFSEENKGNHNWFALTDLIDSYSAVDEKTFELNLKDAYSATLYDLAMIRPIRFLADAGFPKGDNTEKDAIKAPIGTGPWVVKEKKNGEYITFARNEDYWGTKPALKEVTVKVIPDPQTRALEFEAGNIDLLYGNGIISLETFSQYAKDKDNYVTAVSQPMSTRLLLLNAKNEVFKDVNVRKAFNHAIDKASIAENLFRGAETPADNIFSKSTPHADAGLTPYAFDFVKAESMLDQAGWKKNEKGIREKDGQTLTLSMPYIATKATDKDLSEFFQGELKKLGVDVQLQAMEEDDYWSNASEGKFDLMLTYSWGAPWDPHAWMQALTTSSANGNPEAISLESLSSKPELDNIIKATLVEPDEAKVDEGYKQALTILHDEAVYIPLTYQSVVSVYRKGELDGVRFAPEENSFPTRYIKKIK